MAVPQAVRDRFDQDATAAGAVYGYVRPAIARFCDDHDYGLSGRPKGLDSLAEKLESGRYAAWDEVDDRVAFTIVVPTSSHEPEVVEFLRSAFDLTDVRSRDSVAKPPDVFRFDATRCYGRVSRAEPEPDLEPRAFEILFEIQIKTAFEHAWSVVTHDLVYKSDDVSWAKRRLAAQLKAMVEQIDSLVDNFERAAGDVPGTSDYETESMARALAVLQSLQEEALIDASLLPASWSRLAENLLGVASSSVRGRGRRAAEKLDQIVGSFDAQVRDGSFEPSLSGSLFQAVVAQQIREGLQLPNYPLVDGAELGLYGVTPALAIVF